MESSQEDHAFASASEPSSAAKRCRSCSPVIPFTGDACKKLFECFDMEEVDDDEADMEMEMDQNSNDYDQSPDSTSSTLKYSDSCWESTDSRIRSHW